MGTAPAGRGVALAGRDAALPPRPVAVVTTGIANLASVMAGLRRAGAEPATIEDARAVDQADYVVLPGVGSFAPAMERLRALGLERPLRERITAGRPTLAVCLGLQLFGRASEEDPGIAGLGLIDVVARRFPATLRVPQLGWNHVAAPPGARFLRDGHAYFANSYRFEALPPGEGWMAATSDHGGPFVAAFERGGVLACQFHPELSGAWGLALLRRWLGVAPAREADGGGATGGPAPC